MTGGHGDGEHFFPPADFAKHLDSAKTMETCCTHNMLRLTRMLFRTSRHAAYFDYYERALYNGILASQDPESGMMTYFQATRPGYVRLFHTPERSFWCCTGTGIENHAKYGDSIYFRELGRAVGQPLHSVGRDVEGDRAHAAADDRLPRDAGHAPHGIDRQAAVRATLHVRRPAGAPAWRCA